MTDLAEGALNPSVLAHHCVDWSVGPLRVHACVDLGVPEVDVSLYLVGVKIGQVKLNRGKLCATLGGSVNGFKAKVKICLALQPIRLIIDAQLCLPIVGCKKFHHEIHLAPHQALEEGEASAQWE